jgi:hypothetical protein
LPSTETSFQIFLWAPKAGKEVNVTNKDDKATNQQFSNGAWGNIKQDGDANDEAAEEGSMDRQTAGNIPGIARKY